MIDEEKDSHSQERADSEGDPRKEESESTRPSFQYGAMSAQVDDKIATLISSFEKRIVRLQSHVSNLEGQLAELRISKEKVRTALDEFLGVAELTEMLKGTDEPLKVADTLRILLKKVARYNSMGIYLFNEGRSGLDPLGMAPLELTRALDSQFEEGVVDWVINERRPLVVPWMESFGHVPDSAGNNLVICPMVVVDNPFGVVLFSTSRTPDEFSAYEIKMINFFVSHAAVAIHNSLRANEINTSKKFLHDLLENAGDVIFALNAQGKFNYLNQHVEELGFQKSDLFDQPYKVLFKSREMDQRIRSTLQHGSKQRFDLEMINAQGRKQDYTINLVPLNADNGHRSGALGIMHNVTEIQRLQKKLLESERLAAYTQTVITLNHEINNPLTAVLGNIYLLEKDTAKLMDEKLNQRLKVIQDNCLRIQRVIKKLERIDELKTVSYLGKTKMVDLTGGDDPEL